MTWLGNSNHTIWCCLKLKEPRERGNNQFHRNQCPWDLFSGDKDPHGAVRDIQDQHLSFLGENVILAVDVQHYLGTATF